MLRKSLEVENPYTEFLRWRLIIKQLLNDSVVEESDPSIGTMVGVPVGLNCFYDKVDDRLPDGDISHILEAGEALNITPGKISSEPKRRFIHTLIHHPNRVMNISTLKADLHQGGIRSSYQADRVLPFDTIKGQEDRIHVKVGPPYIFGVYGSSEETNNCLVVCNGPTFLNRPDVQIPFTDSGFIYRYLNPFSRYLNEMLVEHPEVVRTPNDPYMIFIDEVLRNPRYKQWFDEKMAMVYASLCLSPDSLYDYMESVLDSLFPYIDHRQAKAEADIGLYFPEVNVATSIPIAQIEAVLLYSQDYIQMCREFPNLVDKFIDIGEEKSSSACARDVVVDLPLLDAYAHFVKAHDLWTCYIELLTSGQHMDYRQRIRSILYQE